MLKFNPSRTSVFGKIAFLLAFSTAVVGIALTFMAWKVTRDLAIDNLHAFADGASNDLAQKSARAIRFNDAAEIERLAVDLFELSANRVESIVVLGADGGTRYASAGDAPYHAAFVEFTKATDEPRYQDLDRSRFMKAVPALMGAEGTQVGVIGIVWSAEAVLAQVTDRKYGSIGLALVLFLAMIALAAFMVRRSITEPLKSIGESLQDIVAGRYDTEIGGRERQDELGVFARNIVDLQKRLQESRAVQSARDEEQAEQQRVVSELRSGLRALSQQDLTQSLIDSFSEEYEPLRSDYNQGIEGLRQIVSAVIENSEAVRLSAEEISSSSDNLARRTETQAATLEETSATLTEITKSVSEAANNAREVEGIVLGAQAQTEQSDEIVQEAVGAMEEIENSSQKIASIISVIDDIAFQTNLLALNAGVEAARAGEAGKGFAVVATEVRSLAQRSADAAKEIKELITGSTQQVDRGVELVRRAGGALSEISNQVTHISELVSGIATSAGEQAHGISEINSGVTQLELVTQENAAMVEQSTAAGHLLREQSVELADLIGQFTINRGRHSHEVQRIAAE